MSVAPTRRRVRSELAAVGVPEDVLDDIDVIVSELLGNAVRHASPIAGGVLVVGWRLETDQVVVRVTDGGSGREVMPRQASPLADSGRGLFIVEQLSSDWGVLEHAGGLRTVYAEVPLPGGVELRPRVVSRGGLRLVSN